MECKVHDINLHYEEIGTGRPLLILHGAAQGNGRMAMGAFEPVFEAHSGWRRIYPDLPGHGKTPAPEWLRGHDALLDIVLEFMDIIAPGERFVVVGWSWGGTIALGVIQHRLKQIDGVILYVPSIRLRSTQHILPKRQVIRHDPEFLSSFPPEEQWIGEMIVAQSRAVTERFHPDFWTFASPYDAAFEDALREKPFSFDPDSLFEPCPAPTLIVTGRQDHIVGYHQAWAILENFPRGTFAVLDRAGHLLGLEQPTLFQALVSEWVDRVEEYVSQRD